MCIIYMCVYIMNLPYHLHNTNNNEYQCRCRTHIGAYVCAYVSALVISEQWN